MGLWYKVGKSDEPKDDGRSRERFELLQRYDGSIRVLYTSFLAKSNRWDRGEDYIDLVDTKGRPLSTSRDVPLPVVFNISRFGPFGVSYQLIALDPQYQWAMVKGPSGSSFSVWARTQELSPANRKALETLAFGLQAVNSPLRWEMAVSARIYP